ncbi:MAG TPA: phosphoribosylaminoimidazolesuccinocarboxamide synthase [Planctomycetes bacterium]|nr:phosphoribosylaminoimidazolesuccinocarboxamide synthase [Planctomycetota bacterium]
MTTVYQTDIPEVPLKARGKVRDIYDLGDQLLIVATDRVSAFDWILPDPIPDKGKVLTQISLFWFDFLSGLAPNHVITGDVDAMPEVLHPYRDVLRGRSMLCRKARPFDAECIVRAYLVGSGWKDYQATGAVCGVPLPPGLHKGSKLPEPIFTPSTKAEQGLHDENIDETVFRRVVGEDNANRLKEFSLEAFHRCSDYAAEKGIILCDTKLEWGLVGDEIILIDEVFTPDSSRFWKKEDWENTPEGEDPPSFDKQVIRDWLETTDWDKSSPPPKVPDDILELASGRYMEIYERLTGRPLER